MLTLTELYDFLDSWSDERIDELIKFHNEAGQRASGESERRFGKDLIQDGDVITMKIVGPAHSEYLDRGRGPGGGVSIDKLTKWVYDKGLASQFDKEYKLKSFVYLVNRKIMAEGTLHHRTGKTYNGFSSPVSAAFSPAAMKLLRERISNYASIEIKEEFIKEFMSYGFKNN